MKNYQVVEIGVNKKPGSLGIARKNHYVELQYNSL